MLIPMNIEVAISVRGMLIVDIFVKTNVPKFLPTKSIEITKLYLIKKLIDIIKISEKFKSRFLQEQPENFFAVVGDIVVSTSIIFPNMESMNGFVSELS